MASSGIDVLTYAVCKAYVDKVAGGGGSSINVVQTTGSSTEDVMSQDATTKMVFQGGNHPTAIRIGNENASAYDNTISIGIGANQKVQGQGAIAIGQNAQARSNNCPVAIGDGAGASADNTVALGRNASAGASQAVAIGRNASTQGYSNSVALGSHTTVTRQGEVAVGCSSSYTDGYNSTQYRVIGGVYDGQEAHDAVTVGQINGLIDAINTATGSSIAHIGA